MHLPPPLHGVNVTNSRIAAGKTGKEGWQRKILPIRYGDSFQNIGKASWQKLAVYISLLLRLILKIALFRPQIVYFSIVPTGSNFYRDALFVFIMKFFRRKIVLHLHGVGIEKSMNGFFISFFYRLVFRNTYVIHQSRSLLPDIEKIKSKVFKIYTIYSAIPTNGASLPIKNLNEKIKFVYISNILRAKGQMVLLQAIQRLLCSGRVHFHLQLIGQVFDPLFEKELLDFIQKHHLQSFVACDYHVVGEERDRILANADVFVFPTLNEAFGLVAVEGMRKGLPLIASDIGTLPEIVEEGCGFLFEPGNAEALADKMAFFLDHPEQISIMGKTAFETFRRKFTFESFENKMNKMFEDVLQAKRNHYNQWVDYNSC